MQEAYEAIWIDSDIAFHADRRCMSIGCVRNCNSRCAYNEQLRQCCPNSSP